MHGFEYKGFNGKAHLFTYKSCDIYFTTPTIPVCNVPSLIHSANVGINISRAEGWNLCLSSNMGCGLPTITTLCTGHYEYVPGSPDIQTNLIVQSNGYVTAEDGFWFKGDQGDWHDINIDSYVSKLEETFNNQTKYTTKNEELADYMSNNFSWNKSTQKLITIIDKYRG
jgi:glycosyltransferase involved in cell wall biosynthesis